MMTTQGGLRRPLLIHIGYHKTGTTWLQRRLFRPEMDFRPVAHHGDVFAGITRPHTLDFNPRAARAAIASACSAETLAPVDVVSSEILSGNPFTGARDSAEIALRLSTAFPEARILITIREQIAAIASLYMQYLRRAGAMRPDAFFAEDPAIGYDVFDAAHFEYDRLIARYHALYGAERVLVLTQERLAADPDGFVASLRTFCGLGAVGPRPEAAPEAASYPESAAFLLRRINHCRRGPANPAPVIDSGVVGETAARAVGGVFRRGVASGLLPDARPIRRVVSERFAGRFIDSNRRLSALLGDAAGISGWQGLVQDPGPDPERRPAEHADARDKKMVGVG